MKCLRCGEIFEGMYCPVCGEAVKKEALPLPADRKAKEYTYCKQTRVVETRRFYKTAWFIIVLLFVCFPPGLFLMWKYKIFSRRIRTVVSVLCTLYGVLLLLSLQSLLIHGTPHFYTDLEEVVNHDILSAPVNIETTAKAGTVAAPDRNIEKYTAIAKQELSRFITDLTYSNSPDDWDISGNENATTIMTKVKDSSGILRTASVTIKYETDRTYYEPLHIEYDGEILFDDGELDF